MPLNEDEALRWAAELDAEEKAKKVTEAKKTAAKKKKKQKQQAAKARAAATAQGTRGEDGGGGDGGGTSDEEDAATSQKWDKNHHESFDEPVIYEPVEPEPELVRPSPRRVRCNLIFKPARQKCFITPRVLLAPSEAPLAHALTAASALARARRPLQPRPSSCWSSSRAPSATPLRGRRRL